MANWRSEVGGPAGSPMHGWIEDDPLKTYPIASGLNELDGLALLAELKR